MSVCCECCMLSGRGLCVRLITGPEERDREASIMRRRPWPTRGCRSMGGKNMHRLIRVLTTMSVYIACDLSISIVHFRNNL
jgi:hypothetical protein